MDRADRRRKSQLRGCGHRGNGDSLGHRCAVAFQIYQQSCLGIGLGCRIIAVGLPDDCGACEFVIVDDEILRIRQLCTCDGSGLGLDGQGSFTVGIEQIQLGRLFCCYRRCGVLHRHLHGIVIGISVQAGQPQG